MKYDGHNLEKVLELHKTWCEQHRSDGSKSNMIADFSNCELMSLDFSDKMLDFAIFDNAIIAESKFNKTSLRFASFKGATIADVHFVECDCKAAELMCSSISYTEIKDCIFTAASFKLARISYTRIKNTNFDYAFFKAAEFQCGYMVDCDLNESDIAHTYFHGLSVKDAKNIPHVGMKCPSHGSFIAWKACKHRRKNVIVKLLIPEDAKRISFTSLKCRADKAVVLEIQDADGNKLDFKTARSLMDPSFVYTVGGTVYPEHPLNEDRFEECSSGIHFFVDRDIAVKLMKHS